MIKFRSKHVCTPGARRNKTPIWKRKPKDKVKVVASMQLPADHIPMVEEKKRKPIDPAKYAVSDKLPQSSRTATGSEIPRVTITCGGKQIIKKAISGPKADRAAMLKHNHIPTKKK